MISRNTIQVFLASPMDLPAERATFASVIENVNAVGRRVGVGFEVVRWETDVAPGVGDDAQDVVNGQVSADYDIFVCLFRDRVGTPTKRSGSGTLEEYERALLRRASGKPVRIMAYFLRPTAENPQIERLKERMADDGVLFSQVEDREELASTLYKDFNLLLVEYARMPARPQPEAVRATANSVAVALLDEHEQLLVVRRSAHLGVGAGLWQIPGGKVDAGERPAQAALREIREELGISLDGTRLTPVVTRETAAIGTRGATSRKLRIHLFCYRIGADEANDLRLNDENEAVDWIDLHAPLDQRSYLGDNRALVRVMWREANGVEALARMLEHYQAGGQRSLAGRTDSQDAALLGLLSALGLVGVEGTLAPASRQAFQLMEAFVSLSRSDRALFEDGGAAPARDLALSKQDRQTLRAQQQMALQSHRALLTVLSCKATLPHSVRRVLDIVVFGSRGQERYLLLRWDFEAAKYQLMSSGLEQVAEEDLDAQARFVLTRRVSPFASTLLSYVRMAELTTHHLSAGSVDDDPILRRYDVCALRAGVRHGRVDDFLDALATHNELSAIQIEFAAALSPDDLKDLDYYQWVPLEEILGEPRSFRGRRVQGVAEIIDAIGRDGIRTFSQQALELRESDVALDAGPLAERCASLLRDA